MATRRSHRHEAQLKLKPCECGLSPALLQVRAGNYASLAEDRRPYLSCPRRRGSRYDDGGCGIPGPWDGCGFHIWLDEIAHLPDCFCKKPGLLRRVVSLKDNGRFFIRCAERRCRFRCWLRLEVQGQRTGRWRKAAESTIAEVPSENASESSNPDTSSSEKAPPCPTTVLEVEKTDKVGYKAKRWGTC